jgi:hypothetical protein
MICAFDQFPKAHQRRKPFCAFKLGALGKNPKAQARSFGFFPKAHQRRNAAARRCAFAPLARRLPTQSAGAVVVYRKHRKPAYGPLGDSLDDFGGWR